MKKLTKEETINRLYLSISDHCCGNEVEIGVAEAIIEQAVTGSSLEEADAKKVKAFFAWVRRVAL